MMAGNGVAVNGYPSLEEIREANGWPAEERFKQGPVAVIECVQEIPCNPCEEACPFSAITVGLPITTIPRLRQDVCTGCGLCVSKCPGLAIFIVDKSVGGGMAAVSFPFEYLPLPSRGDTVDAVNRACEFVCRATVVKVANPARNDQTPVVTVELPLEFADTVRSIARPGAKSVALAPEAAAYQQVIPDDILVCRCEEITAGEIRKAIAEGGAVTVTGVKRRVRAGMGLCQGKSCGRIITRMIAEHTQKSAPEITPATDRPPVRPVSFGELGGDDNA